MSEAGGIMKRRMLCGTILVGLVLAAAGGVADARADDEAGELLVVGTSHLDTQWRWTIQTTIDAPKGVTIVGE